VGKDRRCLSHAKSISIGFDDGGTFGGRGELA
jgi:hypothetical protein